MRSQLTKQQVHCFRTAVYSYYRSQGRSLPWRKTTNPYRILVSEVMLQQTQVDRVIPKYKEFLKAFPTVHVLAQVPLKKVLKVWSGLGYNRRAKSLKQAAEIIVNEYHGKIPSSLDQLVALPGIGHNTASAILVFACDKPVVFIETNIRSVFIHHFFSKQQTVNDALILRLVEQSIDMEHPRLWYSALMDYGVYIKKQHSNPSRRSTHHLTQSRFTGSNRQLRGLVIKLLLKEPQLTAAQLVRHSERNIFFVRGALHQLQQEGLIRKAGMRYIIAN